MSAFIDIIAHLPNWVQWLLQGISIFGLMATGAVVATRAGRNPYWGIAAILPYIAIVVFWAFAFSRWPAVDGPEEQEKETKAEPV